MSFEDILKDSRNFFESPNLKEKSNEKPPNESLFSQKKSDIKKDSPY